MTTLGSKGIRLAGVGAALALLCLVLAAWDRAPGAEYSVIVNPANAVHAVSRVDAAAYFLKRRTSWPDGSVVVPVDLPAESHVREVFSRDVLQRSPSAVSAYWIQEIFAGRSEPPSVLATPAAVIAYVSSTPGAIGYIPATAVSPTVRVVALIP